MNAFFPQHKYFKRPADGKLKNRLGQVQHSIFDLIFIIFFFNPHTSLLQRQEQLPTFLVIKNITTKQKKV